jgi:hypothetical protein
VYFPFLEIPMSWSGSGTIKKTGSDISVNISASPQSNAAKDKSLSQIDAAKEATESIVSTDCYDDGEYGVSISGHAHGEGDSGDSCSVSLYRKS